MMHIFFAESEASGAYRDGAFMKKAFNCMKYIFMGRNNVGEYL